MLARSGILGNHCISIAVAGIKLSQLRWGPAGRIHRGLVPRGDLPCALPVAWHGQLRAVGPTAIITCWILACSAGEAARSLGAGKGGDGAQLQVFAARGKEFLPLTVNGEQRLVEVGLRRGISMCAKQRRLFSDN